MKGSVYGNTFVRLFIRLYRCFLDASNIPIPSRQLDPTTINSIPILAVYMIVLWFISLSYSNDEQVYENIIIKGNLMYIYT